MHKQSFLYATKPCKKRQSVMVADFVAIPTSLVRLLYSLWLMHVEIINDENSPRKVFLFIINNWLYNQGLTMSSL